MFGERSFLEHLLDFCLVQFDYSGHFSLTAEKHGSAADLLSLNGCEPFNWSVLPPPPLKVK